MSFRNFESRTNDVISISALSCNLYKDVLTIIINVGTWFYSFNDDHSEASYFYYLNLAFYGVGNIIKVKMAKSRFTKENKQVEVLLTYDKGLDKYYGLLDLAEKYKVFKKVSTRYELPDGSKEFGKTIMNNPEKYFTEDVMSILEEAAKKEFMYGLSTSNE